MIANQQYTKWVAVVQSDSVNFLDAGGQRLLCDAIYAGGNGNVAAVLEDGSVVTIPVTTASPYIFGKFKRINDTGTTITDATMFALYDI